MVIAEVHLALHCDLRARRGDLGRDRLRGARSRAVGVDIPDHLAERVDREGEGLGRPSVILERDGHRSRLVGRIEIGQHEVLLEAPPGVAFGKEPVVGQLLHANHIGATRDNAGVAAVDATEVGGSLAHHRLAACQHRRDAGWQGGDRLRGEDGAATARCHGQALRADLGATRIVGGRDGGGGGARIEDGQEGGDAAATGLCAHGHIGEVKGGAGMGHAHHIAAAVGAKRREVHGTLRHDAVTVGCRCAIHRDGGGI